MLQTTKKQLCAMGAVILFLTNCTKEADETILPSDPAITTEKVKPGNQKTTNTIQADMEPAGQFHNDAIDYVADDDDFENLTVSDVQDLVLEFWENEYGSGDVPTIDPDIDDYDTYLTIADIANTAESDGDISQEAEDFFLDLEALVIDYEHTTTLFNLTDVTDDLKDFEDDVFNSTTLSEEDKYKLIGSSVVARYSLTYWTDAYDDINHPLNSIITTKTDETDYDLPSVYNDELTGDNHNGGVGYTPARISLIFVVAYDLTKYVEWVKDCPERRNHGFPFGDGSCQDMVLANASMASIRAMF
ncbi:MAG: hypothetical protein CMO34_06400 [Verrucomicrobia bacterium]|nr:hypothetical protein [Verrucomicrobiota bacterium]|tara:strand:- start:74 stop:982 length:909 start_codon:yes stop_codon:yes gene_type:complete